MRFFIALEIPEESKTELRLVQKSLQRIFPKIRLTDNGKLHLTIAFVGEQPESLKDQLIQILKNASKGVSAFEVTPAYMDGFPHLHGAHTLWIGVKGEIDQLYKLHHRIRDGLKNLGLSTDEKSYIPHIAIAKTANLYLSKNQETALDGFMSKNFRSIKISSIKLFESIPNHGFHKHNTLAEIPLIQV